MGQAVPRQHPAVGAPVAIPSTGYPSTLYDGGPEEGTRGPVTDYSMNSATGDVGSSLALGTRYDGGPEEGTRGPGR